MGTAGEGLSALGLVGSFLFLLVALRQHSRSGGSGLRYGLVVGVVAAALLGQLTNRLEWGMFLPLLLLLGVATFVDMITQQHLFLPDSDRYLVLLLITLVVGPPLIKASLTQTSAYPPVHPGLQAYEAAVVKGDGLLLTDIPEAMAWYGERAAMALPAGYTNFVEATSNLVVDGILITAQPETIAGRRTVWGRLWDGEVPAGCTFTNAYWLPAGTRHQLLLVENSK
jgi:hypothetical protein